MTPPFTPMILSPHRSELLAGVRGLAPAYQDGLLDPVQVTDSYLDRIGHYDDAIGAFADLDIAGARAAAASSAARWARGRPLSALDGVPLAVKSNIAVAGLPWTAGIGAYRHRMAERDATCVARLRSKGAIIVGTTRMDEAALGAVGNNPWFGRTRNPGAADHIAGGSSGGSAAAVAAGFCAAALGTDSFGSVRIPASYCGVFGLKPKFGAVSTTGIVPLTRDFDTVGFLARSAEDCRILLDCLALPADPTPALSMVGMTGFAGDLAPLGRHLPQRLAELGIECRTIDWEEDPFQQGMKPALLIAEVDAARTHRDILNQPSAEISTGLRSMLEWGAGQPPAKLTDAKLRIAASKAAIFRQIAAFDLIVTPTTATVAPRLDHADDRSAARFTMTASLSGLPALALPFGRDANGLPCSLQIMGKSTDLLIALASNLAI